MSAYRYLTLILTLSCLVSNVAASELAYLPPTQSTPESQVSRAKNQLIWAEAPTVPPAPAVTQTSITPTEAANKNTLKSKFFRPFQTRAPKQEIVAAADQTKLLQPSRISAGKPLPSVSSGPQNLTDQSSEIQTSRNFMDRLRQLSTGEEVKKLAPAPTPVMQAALSEDVASASGSQINGLVYASDGSQPKDKSNPEIVLTQVYSEQLQHALSAIPAVETIEPTAKQPEFAPASIPYPEPEKIVFRPAVIDVNRYGQAVLRPDVLTAAQHEEMMGGGDMEALPPVAEPVIPEAWSAPLVSGTYQDYQEHCEPRLGPFQALYGRVCARLTGPCGCEPGLGTERVMHAISFIDTTQPMQNFRLRFDAGYDYQSPDRAEYFWARIGGRGPGGGVVAPAPRVDYQDIRTYMEVGGDKFSVGTDVPIRIVDPSNAFGNHSGIGDVNITTKTLFLDGKDWQITNLFRTHIPSGNPAVGLGTGHASIEPGFAMRYKYSDYTYFHGDLKYWIPLGGDPNYAGEVLNYGIAMSHVWRETDTYAIMPTFELKAYSFLDGQETSSTAAAPVSIDPEGILIAHPGIRWAWDHGTDCGLREVGIFGGFALTSDSLYEELIRLEFRWNW